MCGIFFSIGFDSLPDSVIDSVTHRGPDARGWQEFVSPYGKVILAHRRLSILDLSADGNQPMYSSDRRYCITYNGEIYNYLEIKAELQSAGYIFKSNTDTEVILAGYIAWGEACLEKFNGMFAFVIWDDQSKRFFAARDRFGVKTLYYYADDHKLAFASEVKQLCQIPEFTPTVNVAHLEFILLNRHQPLTPSTMFENIKQVAPGHYVGYEPVNADEYVWYHPKPKFTSQPYDSEFKTIFEDSVRKRMLADVPVGALLSGGLDSSAIVCTIANLLQADNSTQTVETFTSWADDPRIDETEYSDAVIAQTGLKNHLVEIKDDSLQADIENIIYHQEEPFLSTSIQSEWNIYKNIASATQLKVVLDGQGSDELTCGYLFMIPQVIAHYLRKGKYLSALKEYLFTLFRQRTISGKTLMVDALSKSHPNLIAFIQKSRKKDTTAIYKELFASFEEYSVYAIRRFIEPQLKWQDRSSMAFSIESRQPFLDYRLVEFLLSVPIQHKYQKGITKRILRTALRGILPEIVRNRRSKFGFPSPQRTLMQNLDREYFAQHHAQGLAMLRKLQLESKWRDGDTDQYRFFVFTLGLWSKIYQVKY